MISLRRRMAGSKPGWEYELPVSCGLADDKGFPIPGKVCTVAANISGSTGTQLWMLVLPNKDGVLVPGMFLRVRLATSARTRPCWCRNCAIGSDQGRKFVFVVNDQNAAECRDVEIGQVQDDGLRVVTKGLSGDDRVLLDHFSKVTAGMTVKPEETPAAAQPSTR